MVLEGVLADDGEDLPVSPGVATRVDVEGGMDEALDVLNGDDLSMEVSEGRGFMKKHGVINGVLILVVRHLALSSAPSGSGTVATTALCLAGTLPPDAATLEATAQAEHKERGTRKASMARDN